jgi:hypothetical protein
LALIEAVAKLGDGAGTTLRVRVGIATGLVVVGDLRGGGPAQEYEVVGETPNLAARLQALAEPDTVVIAGTTRLLLGELFEYRALGTVSIKGFGDPVQVWQVIGRSAVDDRFKALRATTTPLVGRDEEIEQMTVGQVINNMPLTSESAHICASIPSLFAIRSTTSGWKSLYLDAQARGIGRGSPEIARPPVRSTSASTRLVAARFAASSARARALWAIAIA